MKNSKRLTIFGFLVLTASQVHAAGNEEQKVFSDGVACLAKVFSKNSIVIPSHCLENDQEILFQDYGPRKISRVVRNSPYVNFKTESLVIVEFREHIFPQAAAPAFGRPEAGNAEIHSKGARHDCKILSVDAMTKTFSHNCAGFDGESGTTIYQNGKAVGMHLGEIKNTNTFIAALQDGPDFSKDAERFQSFHAQGLKVSCCKKLDKAVSNLGDAISDGAEALKDFTARTAENIKAEIGRVEQDIAAMPRVLSADYVRGRVLEIKTPKLPKIEIDQSIFQGGRFQWDLPAIKVPVCVYPDEIKVLRKVKTSVAKGLDDTGYFLTKAGKDLSREWHNARKYIQEHVKFQEHGICGSIADDDELKDCIENLKADIKAQEAELKSLRGDIRGWVDEQKELLNK